MQILCLCVKPGSKHTTVIVFLILTGFSATGWIDVNVEVVVYVREHINISRVQFNNVLLGAEFIWLKFFVDDRLVVVLLCISAVVTIRLNQYIIARI